MTTIDSMFELAIELRDKGELRDSINVLFKILNDYSVDERTHGIHTVLRIRDAYPGSRNRIFQSRIPDPDPHQRI